MQQGHLFIILVAIMSVTSIFVLLIFYTYFPITPGYCSVRLSSPITGLEWPRGFQEVKVKVKVKQSHYRSGPVQRVPGS